MALKFEGRKSMAIEDHSRVMESLLHVITGSALALYCCKAHIRTNRKMGNLTTCKIITPKNFQFKSLHCKGKTWRRSVILL